MGAHSELGIAAPSEVHNNASGNFSHAKKLCRRQTKLLRLTSSHLHFVAEPLAPLSCSQTGDGRIGSACVLVYSQVFQLNEESESGVMCQCDKGR